MTLKSSVQAMAAGNQSTYKPSTSLAFPATTWFEVIRNKETQPISISGAWWPIHRLARKHDWESFEPIHCCR